MKRHMVSWFVAGFAAAVVLGVIGTLIGVRRNVLIADEEATISLPAEEEKPVPVR
jgi:ABC-type Mn2+/Zn2+ transport system permease subunit